jgi:hypothetical protein
VESQLIPERQLREARRLSLETIGAFDVSGRIPLSLSLLDFTVWLRPQKSIEDRALCLSAFMACKFRYKKADALDWLAKESILYALTPREHEFLHNSSKWTDLTDRSEESIWAIAWALQFVGNLDFQRMCEDHLVNLLPNLKVNESSEGWRARANLRPVEEILCACDLAYCVHWASRQRALEGRTVPTVAPGLSPWIIEPGRRALDWMLSNEQWTEVNPDT